MKKYMNWIRSSNIFQSGIFAKIKYSIKCMHENLDNNAYIEGMTIEGMSIEQAAQRFWLQFKQAAKRNCEFKEIQNHRCQPTILSYKHTNAIAKIEKTMWKHVQPPHTKDFQRETQSCVFLFHAHGAHCIFVSTDAKAQSEIQI